MECLVSVWLLTVQSAAAAPAVVAVRMTGAHLGRSVEGFQQGQAAAGKQQDASMTTNCWLLMLLMSCMCWQSHALHCASFYASSTRVDAAHLAVVVCWHLLYLDAFCNVVHAS
jgi:hypothetical protein